MAKFLFDSDRLSVLEGARRLKESGFDINEQFLYSIEERKKTALSNDKRIKNQGNKIKLVKDRLYLNGNLYTVEEPSTNKVRTQKKWIGLRGRHQVRI